MPKRVIMDTDIGTDVDDCLALAVILGSPELKLEGVTCVYGDVNLRARMAMKLLQLAGRTDVPVMTGSGQTLLGVRDIFWQGHEGKGLLEPRDNSLAPSLEHAVDYIVRSVMEAPGEIHLLAIGPLTNVALALRREPQIAERLASLMIMGGAQRSWDDLGLPFSEHNFACDPEAALVVMQSGAPIALVPLDVTTKVSIDEKGLERVRGAGTPFHDAVATQVDLYPRFQDQGSTFLHDPLAAALLIEPLLADSADLRVEIETEGRFGAGMSLMAYPSGELGANAEVALSVDIAAAEAFVMDRISNSAHFSSRSYQTASVVGGRPGPVPPG